MDPDQDLDATRAREAVESDIRLLVLARFSDRTATVELWNRYYTAAWMAASANSPSPARTTKTVARAFQHWMSRAEKEQTRITTFLANWFQEFGAAPPDADRRVVSWAFYAMDERNRTILWRGYVDGWTDHRLAVELGMDPDQIVAAIDETTDQFCDYLKRATDLLGLDQSPAESDDPTWLTTALTTGLLGLSPAVVDQGGSPLNSPTIISPPLPEGHRRPTGAPPVNTSPAGLHWSTLALPVRIGACALLVVALVGGGYLATRDRFFPGSANSVTPTLTPIRTPSVTPTPTAEPTPAEAIPVEPTSQQPPPPQTTRPPQQSTRPPTTAPVQPPPPPPPPPTYSPPPEPLPTSEAPSETVIVTISPEPSQPEPTQAQQPSAGVSSSAPPPSDPVLPTATADVPTELP